MLNLENGKTSENNRPAPFVYDLTKAALENRNHLTRHAKILSPELAKIISRPGVTKEIPNRHRDSKIVYDHRTVHGSPMEIDEVNKILASMKAVDEVSLWDFLTDKDLLPPNGKNLLPEIGNLKIPNISSEIGRAHV